MYVCMFSPEAWLSLNLSCILSQKGRVAPPLKIFLTTLSGQSQLGSTKTTFNFYITTLVYEIETWNFFLYDSTKGIRPFSLIISIFLAFRLLFIHELCCYWMLSSLLINQIKVCQFLLFVAWRPIIQPPPFLNFEEEKNKGRGMFFSLLAPSKRL